jgi:hypothetical protein
MDEITGGCQCGRVRIVAVGRPRRVGLCHCLDCRKHHGAPVLRRCRVPRGGGDGERGDPAPTAVGPSVPIAARRSSPAATRSRSIWAPWTRPTGGRRPTRAGPSAARPGCPPFRSCTATTGIATRRTAPTTRSLDCRLSAKRRSGCGAGARLSGRGSMAPSRRCRGGGVGNGSFRPLAGSSDPASIPVGERLWTTVLPARRGGT